jgi:hypothetical protein
MARTFLEFDAGEFFANINKEFAKNVEKNIIPLIKETILKGQSPVKGERFQPYSDSYRKQIRKGKYSQYGKKTRPVNLKLSGNMLSGFKVNPLKRGGVSIFNRKKLVKYHNDLGAGRSRVIRKFIPNERGQEFKPFIQNEINNQLEKAISKVLKK